jgi:hypothetical protein
MNKFKKIVKDVINNNNNIFTWQDFCKPVYKNFNILQLRDIAKDFGIKGYENLQKRELCYELSKNLTKMLVDASIMYGKCNNRKTLISMEDISTIPKYNLFTIKENQGGKEFLYCFDILELKNLKENPYTRKKFSNTILKEIKNKYNINKKYVKGFEINNENFIDDDENNLDMSSVGSEIDDEIDDDDFERFMTVIRRDNEIQRNERQQRNQIIEQNIRNTIISSSDNYLLNIFDNNNSFKEELRIAAWNRRTLHIEDIRNILLTYFPVIYRDYMLYRRNERYEQTNTSNEEWAKLGRIDKLQHITDSEWLNVDQYGRSLYYYVIFSRNKNAIKYLLQKNILPPNNVLDIAEKYKSIIKKKIRLMNNSSQSWNDRLESEFDRIQ